MSESLAVCKALAAMLRTQGELSHEEVNFVAQAALQLGLASEEIQTLQATMRDGAPYAELLGEITSRSMRTFFFRRVVAASLLDEQITAKELSFINQTAEAFGFKPELVSRFIDWMKQGIAWERAGVELMAQL
ncbi:MAG: hypothetical protein IT371_09055 [Deltaproteobacteria bacterium]|nr:hypothetical protein [Deltaproteobacteria bacterium]